MDFGISTHLSAELKKLKCWVHGVLILLGVKELLNLCCRVWVYLHIYWTVEHLMQFRFQLASLVIISLALFVIWITSSFDFLSLYRMSEDIEKLMPPLGGSHALILILPCSLRLQRAIAVYLRVSLNYRCLKYFPAPSCVAIKPKARLSDLDSGTTPNYYCIDGFRTLRASSYFLPPEKAKDLRKHKGITAKMVLNLEMSQHNRSEHRISACCQTAPGFCLHRAPSNRSGKVNLWSCGLDFLRPLSGMDLFLVYVPVTSNQTCYYIKPRAIPSDRTDRASKHRTRRNQLH